MKKWRVLVEDALLSIIILLMVGGALSSLFKVVQLWLRK